MSEQITTADPDLQERFSRYLSEDGVPAPDPAGGESTDAPVEDDASVAPDPDPEAEPSEEPQEDSAEPVDSEPVQETGEEGDADAVETLSDLARAFEVEEAEFLDHLQVPAREGDGTVSLSEVIRTYRDAPTDNEQARIHYENLGNSLQTDHDQRLMELQKLTAAMISQVEAEPSVDWDMLRETDPAQYLMAGVLRDAGRADIDRSLKSMDDEMKRREAIASEERDKWRSEQVQVLYRLRPDWKDAEKGRSAMSEVHDYLVRTGYTEDQISELEDAKSVLTVWRAAQWEKLQAQRPGVKKRLRLLPRTLRSAARADVAAVSGKQAEEKEQERLRGRLAETGSVQDAAALMKRLV